MWILFKKPSGYLRKLVLSYLALTVVIISLFGGYFTKRTNDLLAKEISKESLYELERVKSYVEDNYLERYHNALLDKAMTTIRESSMEEVHFFLDHPIDGNYFRATRLVHDLKTLSITQPGLDNVTIVFDRSGFIVDTNYFYADPQRSPNGPLIDHLQTIEPHKWFVRDQVSAEGSDHKVLSYIYTLPYKSAGSNVKGYMIVDVNAEELMNNVRNMLRHSKEQIYLFTDTGMLSSDLTGKGPVLDDNQIVAPLLQSQVTTIPYRNGTVLSVLPPERSQLGWSYASIRPITSYLLLTQTLKKEIWLVIASILIIGLLLSYLLSLRLDKPIQLLTYRINQLHRHVRDKHLQDMLSGTLSVDEKQFPFPEKGAFAAALLTPVEPHRRDELKEKLEQKQQRLSLISIPWGKEHIAIVYQLDDTEETDEVSRVAEIRNELNALRLKIGEELKFSAGIGCIVEEAEQLIVSFTEAQEAAQYKFLLGEQSIVIYQEIRTRSSVLLDLMPGEIFENLIHGGTPEQIQHYFADIHTRMQAESYSIQGIELYLNQLTLCLTKIMLEAMTGDYVFKSPNELMSSHKKETFTATLQSLEALSLELAVRLQYRPESLHSVLAHTLKSYIEENLQHDISLDELANVTSYSKQFICKVFKEQYSQTIADYLTKIRIEKAKELLADDRLSISDVAEQSGYRSPGYFGTKFKQYTGVTPMQYRSMPPINKSVIHSG
ncbi:helix-turn-helix domain-containing protein [Paenibacillus sp. LMG 31461]|uniref:Helix-turn-helix domain-containing protein n=1 Tax=Paenibacillus plantarum TaxID=2654975 RepID=A0ABX1XFS6_9BACL|nr:helix-turn-helix domain-containing protein [Paenibacillus plantarum]NOU67365.1 helix-turn-helix domain-containing protein [Paenibacillus plantarum]